ncbi:MAG: DUF1003 domain-containing protein [Chloroflexi bacterium]|nr:MAG: DUF1003 domain-containing protein [Chloroflexota bacterium]
MSINAATPHPHVQERKRRKPPQVADEHAGFNGRLAVFVTRLVGTMWAVYFVTGFILLWMALGTWGPLHSIDPYPFAFLLFLGNVAELMLLSIILVGQAVLGAAADKRALQTYRDAEAILHEVVRLHRHLMEQDKILNQGVVLVEHQPHPWIERRKAVKPVRVVDQYVGVNGRIAARLTRAVGTMWAGGHQDRSIPVRAHALPVEPASARAGVRDHGGPGRPRQGCRQPLPADLPRRRGDSPRE